MADVNIWAPGSDVVLVNANDAAKFQHFVAAADQRRYVLTDFIYELSTNALRVIVAGIEQVPGRDFVEVDQSTVDLTFDPEGGEDVLIWGFTQPSAVLDSLITQVSADAATSSAAAASAAADAATAATDAATASAAATAAAASEATLTGVLPQLVLKDSDTGSAALPVGTTAERTGSPASGNLRFNSDLNSFEGFNGSDWGNIGGGASGGGANSVFYENDTNVTDDYTITTGKNAMSAGPITVDSGVTVTVPTGSTWTVV